MADEEVSDVRIRLVAAEAAGRALGQERLSSGNGDSRAAATRVVEAAQVIEGYIRTGATYW